MKKHSYGRANPHWNKGARVLSKLGVEDIVDEESWKDIKMVVVQVGKPLNINQELKSIVLLVCWQVWKTRSYLDVHVMLLKRPKQKYLVFFFFQKTF